MEKGWGWLPGRGLCPRVGVRPAGADTGFWKGADRSVSTGRVGVLHNGKNRGSQTFCAPSVWLKLQAPVL